MMEGMVSSPSQSKVSTAESTALWFRVISSLVRAGDSRSSLFVSEAISGWSSSVTRESSISSIWITPEVGDEGVSGKGSAPLGYAEPKPELPVQVPRCAIVALAAAGTA